MPRLARYPNDLRFEREAELLTRIRHPSVPRLLGQGTWKASPHGDTHPYVVMQWVEGIRLYDWGKERSFTSRQVLRLLAQVARALEATHARQGLHRDVKGENILVSPEGKAFLMDFGCGTWAGAPPLTEGLLAPGTKPYRSPQALRFQWDHRREAHTPYRATPADDVYALGVTAYRLCTGMYPPSATAPSLVGNDARDTLEVMKPPGQLQPLAPLLESLILRMLSESPQDRSNAGELAAAMEAAAEAAGPEADAPMCPNGARGRRRRQAARLRVSRRMSGVCGADVLGRVAHHSDRGEREPGGVHRFPLQSGRWWDHGCGRCIRGRGAGVQCGSRARAEWIGA